MRDEAELPTLPADGTSGDGVVALGTTAGRYGRFVSRGVIGQGGMGVVLRAHDPELDREVAIKVLTPGQLGSADSTGTARLQREAQAMAKLSHPNVVTVFEMGAAGGSRFIAMELVEGTTLRRWLTATHTWQEIVAAFVACGRGLAAAHVAGLVHRDFKPENVLIGADARPRVTDFGLVATGMKVDGAALGDAAVSGGLTVDGAVIGTPTYMAPEQWTAGECDARTDQFAFCIALWEGAYGERPFDGRTANELRANVEGGKVRPPPRERRVPGYIEAALRRGLSVDRAARWPSMNELLAALDPPRRRRWPVLVAAAVMLGGGAIALALMATTRAPADPCPDPRARAEAVWGPATRQRIAAAFGATHVAYAPDLLARVSPRFDRDTNRWRATHVEACKANRAGRESDTLLDQRMRCLDLWLGELEGTTRLMSEVTDRASIDLAIGAARALSPVSDCADAERLRATPPPPPEKRVEANAIADELLAVRIEQRAGRVKPLIERTAALVARARALDHAPTLAAALLQQSKVLHATVDHVAGKAALEELTQVAARAGDDRAAASAWVDLVQLVGSDLEKPDEARPLVPVARAAIARAGDPVDLRVRLLRNEAMVIDGHGEAARALTLLAEAQTLLRDAGADHAAFDDTLGGLMVEIDVAVGAAHGSAGDYDASAAAFREAIAIAERSLGKDHPSRMQMLANLGETYRRAGKHRESLAAYEEAVSIGERSVGDSPILVRLLARVGGLHLVLEQRDEALVWLDRAVAMAEKVLPPDDKVALNAMTDRAFALSELGRHEEALAAYDHVLAALARTDGPASSRYTAEHDRAGTLRQLGRWDEAITGFGRALELLDHTPGNERERVDTLVGLGQTYLGAKRPAQAIAPLERARDDTAPGRNLVVQRTGRWLLGRARVEARRDAARGLREVREVRAELLTAVDRAEEIAEIDAWLAKH